MTSVLIILASSAFAQQAPQRALLDLRVNEEDQGEVMVFVGTSDVLISVTDLEHAGLKPVHGIRKQIQGETYLSLASLAPDITYKLNETDLVLNIIARPELIGTVTRLDLGSRKPAGIVYRVGTSSFLNYAFNVENFATWTGFAEGGVSIDGNLLYSSMTRSSSGDLIRGLTNFTINHPDRMTSLELGDQFAFSPDPLGGGSFVGGFGYVRNFSLDPYFVRFPTQNVSGVLTTPSTVDIYVNGRLVRQEQLPPGQFQLNNIPGALGSGNTQIIIRNAFGQQTQIGAPYYLSTGVLDKGLSEFGYTIGLQRNDLQSSFDYGPGALLGFHRWGITDWLTPGYRVEMQKTMASGGPMVDFKLPYGQAEIALAGSIHDGQSGGAAWLAYSYVTQSISAGGSARVMSRRYANLSLTPSQDRATVQTALFGSYQLTPWASIFPQYIYTADRDFGYSHQTSLSLQFRMAENISGLVTASRTMQQAGPPLTALSLSISYFFGNGTTATLGYDHQNQGSSPSIQLQKSLPYGPGWGYQVQGATGSGGNQFNGDFQYQNDYGLYEFDYLHAPGQDQTMLNIAGGLVEIGNRIFATRPVQSAFALVRVPDVPGVESFISNQYMGRTDSRGDLLIPNLLPYYGNQLSINDKDIPLDREVESTQKIIAPPQRGGVIVTFTAHRVQAFVGRLAVNAGGRTIIPKLGDLTVKTEDKDYTSPIGMGGEFYLENVAPGAHPARIEFKQGACSFMINLPDVKDQFVRLGTLTCTAASLAAKENP